MDKDITNRKASFAYKWIAAESGNTYLCPVGAIEDASSASEAELKAKCVEESYNPQND